MKAKNKGSSKTNITLTLNPKTSRSDSNRSSKYGTFFARNWRANLQQHCSGTEPGQINLYIYVMFLQICTSTVPALCNFMDPLIRQSKYALSLKSLKMWIFAKQFFKLGKAI